MRGTLAIGKHVAHVGNVGSVEVAGVKIAEANTVVKHVAHVGGVGCRDKV